MTCLGGYWFWFFLRVDVSAEGNPWYRVIKADLFVLSLVVTATFGLDLVLFANCRLIWMGHFIFSFVYHF